MCESVGGGWNVYTSHRRQRPSQEGFTIPLRREKSTNCKTINEESHTVLLTIYLVGFSLHRLMKFFNFVF